MAYLLKPKAKSLVVSTPFANELINHIAMVEERELQTIKEKLQRQQQKEQRVHAIQKQFVEWADKKENKIKQKIQKSTKLKQDHLNKIVKKCQQHEKYLGQKLRQFKTKNKANLKEAWKKAEEFNKHNQNKQGQFSTSKQVSPNRSSPKLKTHNETAESRFIDNRNKKDLERQYLAASYNNASKYGGNSSKEYFKELNQSLKQFKNKNTNTIQMQEVVIQEKETQVSSKLKQTLVRFKNFIEQSQQQKIQQLGKRLEKIQQSRIRKHELNSKKKHHNRTLIDNEDDRKRQQKSKNRTERLHSESFVRQKRVNDWSEINKQKREEMFQMHLQNGTEYLQEQKLKYMKTSLSKKVALSAVQKKLYFQRLNH